ncbi:hypothetical protein ACHHYP_20283 [Achlya hypogyna]|uniref:Tc1-like transposase DDE domain-containing protein n=1 Tax=Achlya hypogyna TaxID=1202772 RepID=A0A1V9YSW8_ACHHY|nr:hypothetical protein ACHHYP_20283 [Achlya hypogyna]
MGQPRSLNERELRQMVCTAATGDYLAVQLKDTLALLCSVRTVRRILYQNKLAVLVGSQKSADYILTLGEYLITFIHLDYGTEYELQQDNVPIHVSRETKEFMREMDIKTYTWPARSPDLEISTCRHNQIKHITF